MKNESLGEIPPLYVQKQLRRDLIIDTNIRDLLRIVMDDQECECSDNVDEQIFLPGGSSYTTRPLLNCLKCKADIALYPIQPSRRRAAMYEGD